MARIVKFAAVSVIYIAHAQDQVPVYVGAGFFHDAQDVLVKAEQELLGRGPAELTASAGYAGGTVTNHLGAACYDDYATNGHAEVVQVMVPHNHITDFASAFLDLFKGTARMDIKGSAQRAVLGVPGGMGSPVVQEVIKAQVGFSAEFKFLAGSGNDAHAPGQSVVWVYDSNFLPFFQAELHHQFNNDVTGLRQRVLGRCHLKPTGCDQDPFDGPCVETRALQGSGGATTTKVTTTKDPSATTVAMLLDTTTSVSVCLPLLGSLLFAFFA